MERGEINILESASVQKMERRYFLFGLLNAFMNRLQAEGNLFYEEISWKQCFAMICIQMFEQPPTLKELAQVMGSSHQNVKQLLLKLQDASYVNLLEDEKDKRKQRVVITEQGKKFCKKYDKPSDEFIQCLYQDVEASDVLITIKTITTMENNLKKENGKLKKIVVYKTSTGFTKRYAEWIAQALGCEAVSIKQESAKKLKDYELVIYGGGSIGGSINGLAKIKKLYTGQMIVFQTGATPQEATEMIEASAARNFTEEERKRIPYFYMHSGLNYEKMSPVEKMMMKMFKKMLAGKADKTEEDLEMERMIAGSFDECDKSYIDPLVEYVKNLEV